LLGDEVLTIEPPVALNAPQQHHRLLAHRVMRKNSLEGEQGAAVHAGIAEIRAHKVTLVEDLLGRLEGELANLLSQDGRAARARVKGEQRRTEPSLHGANLYERKRLESQRMKRSVPAQHFQRIQLRWVGAADLLVQTGEHATCRLRRWNRLEGCARRFVHSFGRALAAERPSAIP